MADNLISVVMPAYNCRKTIAQAVDSVLAQDGVDWELIIVNDASPEPLDDVLGQYRGDRRIHYFKNKRNRGVSYTRNRGIRLSKGKWVAFLDADDCWMSGKLKKQLDLLEENHLVLCATARKLMDADGHMTGRIIPVAENLTYRSLLSGNPVNNSSVLVRRDVLLEFPMERDDIHEDYALWLSVLKKYKRACGINEPLLCYRVDVHSKSGNKLKSVWMNYLTFRYVGMSVPQSLVCLARYAVAGVRKYYFEPVG